MKVWELNSPKDIKRFILEQDLIIQELREENKKLSSEVTRWMAKCAETQAKLSRIIDGN